MNYVTNSFLLVITTVRSRQLLCFVHGQGQRTEQKRNTKNFVEFALTINIKQNFNVSAEACYPH